MTFTPYIVFKGTPKGKSATEEVPNFPKMIYYACQKRAGVDKTCMLDCVNKVLQPHVATAPAWVAPILFFDAYCCYMQMFDVTKIPNLGVEVCHIPPGCSCVEQPMDVGYNKPLKYEI